MKQILFLCSSCALLSLGGQAQQSTPEGQPQQSTLAGRGQFTLNGHLTGQITGKAKLYYTDAKGKRIWDSALIQDGHFSFHGYIDEPTMAYLEDSALTGSMDDPHATSFFLEPATVTIELTYRDFKNAVVTGSKTQDEYQALEDQRKPLSVEMEPLSRAYKVASDTLRKAMKEKKDEATIDTLKYRAAAIHDQFDPFMARGAQLDYAFFAAHPQSYATAFYLQFHVNDLSLDSLQLFYDRLGAGIQNSRLGKELFQQLTGLKAGSPGSVASDFSARDLHGHVLTLSGLKGKYVLIDFWASWCIPCRKSMPHVKELYASYKGKGLEVIAVSDDDNDSSAWKKAVAKDGTDLWHNVLRGLDWAKMRKGEKSEHDISNKFGIHSLPTKILIDPNGVIIGRYDKGTDEEALALDKKLAQVMGG